MSQIANKIVIDTVISVVPAPPKAPFLFRNYYLCPKDGIEWRDEWNHSCNDRCPVCDAEIGPYFSEDIQN
jgi:hypothetical protein